MVYGELQSTPVITINPCSDNFIVISKYHSIEGEIIIRNELSEGLIASQISLTALIVGIGLN